MDVRKIVTTVARVLVGLLFIFSGLIKANDPLGFSYKLDEYFEVFNMPYFKDISLILSMGICILEVFLGVALLVGAFVNLTVWLLMLTMIFFTFLTFYSAWFNKVTDCGCFGDAVKLTPWQSFWKDVVLTILVLILLVYRQYITPIFGRLTRRTIAAAGAILTLILTFYAWYILPPVDFRPYAEGNNICDLMKVPEGELVTDEMEMIFLYKKTDSSEVEVRMDQLGSIDSTWRFVERRDKIIRERYKPKISNFFVEDRNGDDLTQPFLQQKGYRLMIVQYDLEHTDRDAQNELNELITKVREQRGQLNLWAFTCSSNALADEYKYVYKVPYDFQRADCTLLKTIIRSNPGLVLMKDCTIVKYWSSNNLPSAEKLVSYIR